MLVDLHVYTNVSGGLPLPQAIAAARRKGFEGICVADRQASEASARWVAEGGAGDFPVFLAVEIPTRVGEMLIVVPELDPFYTREEWRALTALAKPSLDEVRALVDAQGGALLLTHPYDRARRVRAQDRFFSLTELDGVELATSGADPSSNALGIEAVSHARVPSFAGSAARKGGEKSGDWATLLGTSVRTQADFVAALRGGDFWPVELMDGQPSGGGDRRGASGGGGPRRGGSGGSGGGGGQRRGGGDGRRRR